jgi:hypothetical protein
MKALQRLATDMRIQPKPITASCGLNLVKAIVLWIKKEDCNTMVDINLLHAFGSLPRKHPNAFWLITQHGTNNDRSDEQSVIPASSRIML